MAPPSRRLEGDRISGGPVELAQAQEAPGAPRVVLGALVALLLLVAMTSVASAATVTYANAPMGGPGGMWYHPVGQWANPTIDHNRMAANTPANHGVGVSVCVSNEPTCRPFSYSLEFIQISRQGTNGWGYSPAIAHCINQWSTITNGYCRYFTP